jgi:hypothetical protein
LGVPLSGALCGWNEPQVRSYRAALCKAVGVLQGQHEGKRREHPDPLDLPQQIRLWVVLLADRLQLSVVLTDALCEGAYLCSRMGSRAGWSASGMCSGALFLWKLLAGHLGKRAPKDLTAPRTLG